MIKHRRYPLHLALDNLSAHKTAAVQAYIDELKGKLTLHFCLDTRLT